MEKERDVSGVRGAEPRFLSCLTCCCFPGGFSRVDVAAGLEPLLQSLVLVQHRPAPPSDYGGRSHMYRSGIAVERSVQLAELHEEPLPGFRLALRPGLERSHQCDDFDHPGGRGDRIP